MAEHTVILDERFWHEYMQIYDTVQSLPAYTDLLKDVCEQLDIKKNEYILDVGSGTGNILIEIAKRGGIGVGVDSSLAAIDVYKKKTDFPMKVIHHDVTKELPFGSNTFDKVVCNNVLYSLHSKERKQLLDEIIRVTKHGGIVVLSDPKNNFDKYSVIKYSFTSDLKAHGLISTISKYLRLLPNIYKLGKYNKIIDAHVVEHPHIQSELDHPTLLAQESIVSSTLKTSYAGQNAITKVIVK